MKNRYKLLSFVISLMMVLALAVSFPAPAYAAVGLSSFPDPVDPQSWKVPEEMTWDDWKDNPVIDWDTDNTIEANEDTHQKGLVILVDYKDKPFILTREKGSDPLENPIVDTVPEEELAEFWENLLNQPSELNHFTSINGFWRENSYGNWDVEIKAFGPYTLPGMEWEYGIDGMNGARAAKNNIIQDTFKLVRESGDEINLNDYNFAFIIHAGYDESGVWQETGEMKFLNEKSVSDEFGPTEKEIEAIKEWGAVPIMGTDRNGNEYQINDITWAKNLIEGANWCKSRYVDWTSWLAAKSVWSFTSSYKIQEGDVKESEGELKPGDSFRVSVQGENDGMATFAHEFGHIRDIGDNYNNPYGIPDGRSYTGGWELMSRGSFSGPGGTHMRYQIPSLEGSGSPAEHMARLKIKQDFYNEGDGDEKVGRQYDRISQKDLYDGSVYTADVVARAIPVGDEFNVDGYSSIIIDLEKDKTPIVPKFLSDNTVNPDYNWQTSTFGDMSNEWYDPKYNDPENGYYQFYSIEVVDRVGYDSFAYDSGVMLAMNREIDNERAPFMWVVDSHPEDINLVDFTREDGEKAMVSKGDARQLADALFHAGTDEDVVNSYTDEYNNLKFYVLDKNYDDRGVLSYRVGVRSTAVTGSAISGSGIIARGVKAESGSMSMANPGRVAVQYVNVTNMGEDTDIFKLTANTSSGWETQLQHEFIEVAAGATVSVPVYVKIPSSNYDANTFNFTATSESNPDESSPVAISDWYPVTHSSGGSSGGGSSSSTTTYTVKFNSNGGSSVSSIKVEKNDTVNEPKEPTYKGYTFEGWYTDKALTKEFDFDTKISSDITLYAKWAKEETKPVEPTEPAEPTTPSTPVDKFTDVANHWASEAIRYVVEQGLMNGTGENNFDPDAYTNRAMLVTILHRLENYPSAGAHQFNDVSTSDWYSDAVAWASENGIVSGLNSGEFAPKNNITREQLVTILFRYAQFKGYATNASADLSVYADNNQVSDWAETAMEWAVGTGLMQGKTASTLNPSGSTTRAEIATILQRFIENITK